ncbi:MAG: tRNA (adenosine(37)-N6)-threonylcarbamoyltransferase complex ATPase subunit type 1 TsaE [Armatimonadetes bacterium]|nr:tRNA (adenosine(37)-N6)-threonylcarbamoyltransferase complex ATPase subunit type 1 TsaE [Armatimonadota bacterium]MDW8121265.1 tRNA (adenosine(37)-N6)-threonylcarbamoyltransferase complex ATPase subunit type 1 TsaE [Armatimonadota bacterium]
MANRMSPFAQWTITTQTAAETEFVASQLSRYLEGGEWLTLFGELGSGKTTFARGLVMGLTGQKTAISPTFLLVKGYLGRLTLLHIDAYRLEGMAPEEIDRQIGLRDFGDRHSVVVIEWADRVLPLLPQERLEVYFEHLPEGRSLRIRAIGAKYERLLQRWKESFYGKST